MMYGKDFFALDHINPSKNEAYAWIRSAYICLVISSYFKEVLSLMLIKLPFMDKISYLNRKLQNNIPKKF